MKVIDEILNKFLQISEIERIYLFGSKVASPEKKDRDFDFCFVVENGTDKEILLTIVMDFLIQEKILIHAVIYEKSEFEEKCKIPVYHENIIEKGKLLYKR